jgi:hypothetical protein
VLCASLFLTTAAGAEDAAVLEEGRLRLTMAPNFAFQFQGWDYGVTYAMAANFGLGAEFRREDACGKPRDACGKGEHGETMNDKR